MPPNAEQFGAEATFQDQGSQPLQKQKTDIHYVPGRGDVRYVVDPNKKQRLNWLHIVILIGIPAFAFYGMLTTPLQSKTVLLGFITYFLTGFGITGGYHRLWSHKAWTAVAPVRFFVLMCGAAAMQGSCRWWSRHHRAHHKFTDTSKDPYNVKKGFFWAHFGWMMFKEDKEEVGRADISDLDADPMIKFQHKYYAFIAVFTSIVIPTLIAGFGWGDFRGGYFYASLVRIVLVHHATFFVNSLAHYLGDQSFSELHTAFDSVVTALLTLGEGYHNYHHEFPQDYRNGIRWFQWDPTKWTILLLFHLGLAYDLKWINENEIKKARVQVIEGRLAAQRNKVLYGKNLDQNLPFFSQEEIQELITKKNKLITVIDGKVYDVTEFADLHPGGRATIVGNNGKEVSNVFHGETGGHIHSKHAIQLLARYIIGKTSL